MTMVQRPLMLLLVAAQLSGPFINAFSFNPTNSQPFTHMTPQTHPTTCSGRNHGFRSSSVAGAVLDPLDLKTLPQKPKKDHGKPPNLGRVIDLLQSDYPNLFTSEPNFEIFMPNLQLCDPTGTRFQGLANYKRMFALLRFMRGSFMSHAEITTRVHVETMARKVSLRWNTKVWLHGAFDGRVGTSKGTPITVDGISVYHVNDEGLVYKHVIEQLIINGINTPPPFDTLFNLQNLADLLDGRQPAATPLSISTHPQLPHQLSQLLHLPFIHEQPSTEHPEQVVSAGTSADFFGDACENAFDCESPLMCCDFLVTKICCKQGMMMPVPEPLWQPIPIPVEPDQYPDPRYPPSGGGWDY